MQPEIKQEDMPVSTSRNLSKLGVIAGEGELPEQLINGCNSLGRDFFIIAVKDITDGNIIGNHDHIWLHLGQIGKAVKAFRKEGVEEIVMVGKVGRPTLSALHLDFSGLRLISQMSKLKSQGDDEIFSTIIKFFEKANFNVVGAEKVLQELMMPAGVLGKVMPDDRAWDDIRLGMKAAHEIGKLDIGQAVIIQRGQILGVEGAEGTDNLMKRCKDLHNEGEGGVLIKMKKPDQDRRVDLPAIGVHTIETAHASGLRGIAVEAASALIINKDKVVSKADELDIFIVGVNPLEQP